MRSFLRDEPPALANGDERSRPLLSSGECGFAGTTGPSAIALICDPYLLLISCLAVLMY